VTVQVQIFSPGGIQIGGRGSEGQSMGKQVSIGGLWQFQGVSVNHILENNDLRTLDMRVCDLFADISSLRRIDAKDIAYHLNHRLFPWREASIMTRNPEVIELIAISRKMIRNSLDILGWNQINHPMFSDYIDFLVQEKINYDTLADCSVSCKFNGEAKETTSLLRERLFHVKNSEHFRSSDKLKALFHSSDAVLERISTHKDLMGAMICPDSDRDRVYQSIDDPRERIENIRRHLQRRIAQFDSYNDSDGVSNTINTLYNDYVSENLSHLKSLDFRMSKNIPYVMMDYHEWIISGKNSLLNACDENFHVGQFIKYTALAENISRKMGTIEPFLLHKKMPLGHENDYKSMSNLADLERKFGNKDLYKLRNELLLNLEYERINPISIRKVPQALIFTIRNPMFFVS